MDDILERHKELLWELLTKGYVHGIIPAEVYNLDLVVSEKYLGIPGTHMLTIRGHEVVKQYFQQVEPS